MNTLRLIALSLTAGLFLVMGAAQAQSPHRPNETDSLETVFQKLREKHLHPKPAMHGRQEEGKLRRELERAHRAYGRAQDSVLHAWHRRQIRQDAEQRRLAEQGAFTQQSLSAAGTSEGLVPDSVELRALRDLYSATGGAGWANSANWLQGTTSADFGTWHGVTVSNGDVIWINLSSNGLSGPVPPSLGSLSSLQLLYLHGNALSGSIPAELGGLKNLQRLYLYSNGLSGPIPAELGDLASLQILFLSSNSLSGSVPAELGNPTGLQILYLHNNGLSGTIPPSLGRLRNLHTLYLYGNGLSGSVPSELGDMAGLRHLYLHYNRLSGPLPSELGRLKSLQTLIAYGNGLSGPLPAELGGLTALQRLEISNNRLSGPVPAELGGLPNLHNLYLHGNAFTSMPDFSQSPSRANLILSAQGNRLDFGSIEPNMAGAGQAAVRSFSYSPQGLLGEARAVELAAGEPLELEAVSGGTRNLYQWERKSGTAWQAVAGATSARYQVPAASAADAGAYRCRVTNGWATALTLYTHEYAVTVLGEAARLAPNLPTEEDCQ